LRFNLIKLLNLKVFEILSSDKYYGYFKTTPQYLKALSEIDITDSLNDNSGLYSSNKEYFLSILNILDAVSVSSNNSNENSIDSTEQPHNLLIPTVSVSSTSSSTSSTTAIFDILDNLNNYSITTEINDSGRAKILF
jgi:hypothetical protein